MNKQIIVILLVALGLTGFLYTRPKSVVKDGAKATRDTQTTATAATKEAEPSENHTPLSAAQQQEVKSLLAQANQADASQKSLKFGRIADIYVAANRFDSAGYYLEQVALASPSVATWSKAGDAYFQAYNLSLKRENLEKWAAKTQEVYQKVLALKPNDLHTRTNLAMTYVTSGSPMQAIGQLRQVLEDEPNYEPALLNMGVLSMQSGQYEKAVDRFSQVLRNNPASVNAQMGLAYSYLELKKTTEAKTIFEGLLKKDIEPAVRQEVQNTLQNIK